MKKFLSILLGVFVAGLCPVMAEPQELVVGTTSGYAPYVSLDAKGNYEGFDIDVARELAAKMGRKLVIKDFGSMPSLMLALKQEKADVLIWAISITEERQKKMEMVYYQGEKVLEMPVLFWKEVPQGISSFQDLAKDSKKAICVEAGSFQEDVVKKTPGINLKYTDKITDAILEIKYGKSQGALIDPSLVSRFQKQYADIKVLRLPLAIEDQSLGNGICVSKKNKELAAQVRKAIEALQAEGKIAELEKKWKLNND
ncbi:MAG: transporter substrate-binding domain-containing protein [Verrucomicrobia bacterium]|nr:transporter substrate-binding domain-containing protein [Verrucomicrobiota bacterium]